MAITPSSQVLHATARPVPREAPPKTEQREAPKPEPRAAAPEPRPAPEPKRVEASGAARESAPPETRRPLPPKPRGTFVDLKI